MEAETGLDLVSIRLVADHRVGTGIQVRVPEDAVRLVTDVIRDMDREFLCLVNLKMDGTPVNCSILSIGTMDSALINVRELMKVSVLSNSAAILLLHNHPGGSLEPSREDIQITNKIQMACELMDIRLYDHLIVGGMTGTLYSTRRDERIEPADLSYAEDIRELQFDPLLTDEAELKEKTVTNMINNYFLTPDRQGVTYKDRLTEGYELMQSIIKELEQAAGAEPALSQKLKETAGKEGILEELPAGNGRYPATRQMGIHR